MAGGSLTKEEFNLLLERRKNCICTKCIYYYNRGKKCGECFSPILDNKVCSFCSDK